MLARGYISDNWHFPDAEFQQIIGGMRRLKPACDELATALAANNMASMQEMGEEVLQLVKDCGKKLTKTIETNNHVPPPSPRVPPAQVILNPILLPLNALSQCQWSIATAVPNTGPVVENAPQANAPQASRKWTCSPGESPSTEQSPTPRPGDPPSSEQWSRAGNYSCANPSGSPNGHSQYATGDATCSPGESPSAEQSLTPRPGDPPSSEQSSRRSESPSAEQPPSRRPGESPSSEQSSTPRPGESPSSECSALGAEISAPTGEYFCNKPSGSPNDDPWYTSVGPTCSSECPSSQQSCWCSGSPSSE